jgi:23S rRNA pseudouridine2605 synthase
MQNKPYASGRNSSRHGIARILSKSGVASRTQAAVWVRDGRVSVNGRIVRDPEFPVSIDTDKVSVDGRELGSVDRVYLVLNKPRGLLTTTTDERDRETVYECFAGSGLPWIAPVGRLDKASEGLLLFSNDPEWAARITDPETGPDKTYRVQVNKLVDPAQLARIEQGIVVAGERLAAKSVHLLRAGEKNCWLEIVLDEGRNRQIRRLLEAFDIGVLRLIRVAIGSLPLGELPKGQWRRLSQEEVAALSL